MRTQRGTVSRQCALEMQEAVNRCEEVKISSNELRKLIDSFRKLYVERILNGHKVNRPSVNAAVQRLQRRLNNKDVPDEEAQKILQIIQKCRKTIRNLPEPGSNDIVERGYIPIDDLVEPVREIIKVVDQNQNAEEMEMVFASGHMADLWKQLQCLAPTDLSVLIQAERGTGKELIARALHQYGRGKDGKHFTAVNCAGFQRELLDSELFGYKKGSFTGATCDRKGLIETTGDGTVFLDEIGDMPLPLQAKILRFLETGECRRVGDPDGTYHSNARVIAATNKDLQKMVHEGDFRPDLLDRLEFPLSIPALRERADVSVLIDFFLAKLEPMLPLEEDARNFLADYQFPGNVRELKKIIRNSHLIAMHNGLSIRLKHVRQFAEQNLKW